MTHSEKAKELFLSGYNCSQAVTCAFCDVCGLDEKTALLISSGFGGGLGRLREVCGAVSGMVMVLSMLNGYTDPKALDEKTALYSLVQQLLKKFAAENGSIICRQLLGLEEVTSDPIASARTKEYYKKRPCAEYVESAAKLISEYLQI